MRQPLPLPDVRDPEARAAAVRAASARRVHPQVLASLRADTPAQQRSRDALAQGVCVVTGQQAGLFGGPLYTLHKAASAIVDARALEAQTGVPCAPVFWLQDEDHDFAEIATAALLDGAGAVVQVQVHGLPEQAGCSVAARRLGPSIAPALDTLADCLEGLPHAGPVLELLQRTHGPDTSPAAAFRAGIEHLFAEHGLLVLDPCHPDLRDAALPVHERAVRQAEPLSQALIAQAQALRAAGRPAPVHVRPGAPLSFVHPDGLDGPRFRVEPDAHGFRLCGAAGRLDADAVAAGPHSTSALLRPILQDTWLPTAAYVGGPGELAYLAQLPPLWAAYGLPVPLVVPRARFTLIDPPARRLLDRLGLQPADLLAPRQDLLRRIGTPRGDLPDPDALLAALTGPATDALDAFGPQARALDPNLARAVDKTAAHLRRAAGRLVDRYRRALADATERDRLDRLLARVAPGGLPQERVLAWPSFAARVGTQTLVQAVLDAAQPFDGSLREVRL